MRIALAQICPLSADTGAPALEKPHSTSPFPTLDANLLQIIKAVEQAHAQNADVVVFPEYFAQGLVNEGRQYLTFPSQHILELVKDLARRFNICIVGTIVHGTLPASADGHAFPDVSPFSYLAPSTSSSTSAQHATSSSHEKLKKITDAQLAWAQFLQAYPATAEDDADPELRNTAFFVEGGTGDLVGSYVKRNLWHPEREYLVPGEEEHRVFNTKWGKAGLLICWDLSHPAAAQALADQGVDVVFAPIYWLSTDSEPLIHNHPHRPSYENEVVSGLCMARAFETEAVWVMCNAGGEEMEGFMGGSGIWAPLRGRIGGLDGEAGVKVIEVDMDVLKVSLASFARDLFGHDAFAIEADKQDAREMYKIREDWSKRRAT